jgi:elongator complex protein 3
MKLNNIKCSCIRCREIGRVKGRKSKMIIRIIHYQASRGDEFFISAETKDCIAGFCRLRFPSAQLREEITKGSALVRELHVYGEAAEIGKMGKVQHRGLGIRLLNTAESLAKQSRKHKIVVISGIGARDYYKKQGYRKQGPYMVKYI